MALELLQYYSQAVLLDDSFLGGVQTATATIDTSVNTLNSFGTVGSKVFRKEPSAQISINRFLSNNTPPFIATGDDEFIKYYGVSLWDGGKTYKLEAIISPNEGETVLSGGSSIIFDKAVLNSISYRLSSDGYFTESTNFTTPYFKGGNGGSTSGGRSGQVYRRQDFDLINSILPQEVVDLLTIDNTRVLKSVELSVNINWTKLKFFGLRQNDYKYQYMQLPIEIGSTFEILDLGYSEPESEYSIVDGNYVINDSFFMNSNGNSDRQIYIKAFDYSFDLGSKNVLTSINRSGGDAENTSSYSTYTYTYQNTSNNFKIKAD